MVAKANDGVCKGPWSFDMALAQRVGELILGRDIKRERFSVRCESLGSYPCVGGGQH